MADEIVMHAQVGEFIVAARRAAENAAILERLKAAEGEADDG